jgi:hypothetical protein
MYIDYEGKNQTVHCKGCRAVVMVNFVPTPEYTELVIAMREPNGVFARHETAMCRSCRTRLIAEGPKPGELEKLYAEDVEQWIEDDIRARHRVAEAYMMGERQALRTPLRVLNEPSRMGMV